MTWLLTNGGRVVFTGSYQDALAAAARAGACERDGLPDGTERAPRLERGWMLFPQASHGVTRRAVA
ncbi:hypothetical protein [Methylobacterium hispanicum]|uniref:hypothetical protein n=1 Tax=Methylobacterium hispanicum TaxID=270350 RepID=UPI002F2F7B4A